MKKILLFLTCILVVFSLSACDLLARFGIGEDSAATYVRCDKSGNADEDGEYLLFGEYPQSLKAADVEITESVDKRGYYLGSDGAYYAKVLAAAFFDEYTFSDGSPVTDGEEYYFKVEPIRWRILSADDGVALILCDSVISNVAYQASVSKNGSVCYTSSNGAPSGTYANDYGYSDIRVWLNGEFYEGALSEAQREIVLTTNVENAGAFGNVEDKIYLLSCEEVSNVDYGFNSSTSEYDGIRRIVVSDYARAKGAFMKTVSEYYGNGSWWLRSVDVASNSVFRIDSAGKVDTGYVNRAQYGVVPALRIDISK